MGIAVVAGWTGLVDCIPLLAPIEGWTGLVNCAAQDTSTYTGEEICVLTENRFLLIPPEDRAVSVRREDRSVEVQFVNRHIEMPPRNKCV